MISVVPDDANKIVHLAFTMFDMIGNIDMDFSVNAQQEKEILTAVF